MKILVMGAGAVGSYFGARLRASGENVVLCARGEHLRVIRDRGLDIKSIRGICELTSPHRLSHDRWFDLAGRFGMGRDEVGSGEYETSPTIRLRRL